MLRFTSALAFLLMATAAACGKAPVEECSALGEDLAPLSSTSVRACLKTKDCPRSCLCRDLGRCETGPEGACVVPNDEACRASRICALTGQCSLAKGVCAAKSDADCRGSDICKHSGRCTARDGLCVAE